MNQILRQETEKDRIINRIIEAEWAMFDKVNNQGGRAGCQDDEWTFYVMRYSQFFAFDQAVLESYGRDLDRAQAEGRNLLAEKYGYMMEYTDSAYFDAHLKSRLPIISPAKGELVDKVANLLIGFEKQFDDRHPKLYGKSRPLMGGDKNNVSFHFYLIGELKTYSEETLRLYYQQLSRIDGTDPQQNPSFLIHGKTVEFYGYRDLEDAETRAR